MCIKNNNNNFIGRKRRLSEDEDMSDASLSSSSSPTPTPNTTIRHYRNVNDINKRYKTGITKPSTTTTMLGNLLFLQSLLFCFFPTMESIVC